MAFASTSSSFFFSFLFLVPFYNSSKYRGSKCFYSSAFFLDNFFCIKVLFFPFPPSTFLSGEGKLGEIRKYILTLVLKYRHTLDYTLQTHSFNGFSIASAEPPGYTSACNFLLIKGATSTSISTYNKTLIQQENNMRRRWIRNRSQNNKAMWDHRREPSKMTHDVRIQPRQPLKKNVPWMFTMMSGAQVELRDLESLSWQ